MVKRAMFFPFFGVYSGGGDNSGGGLTGERTLFPLRQTKSYKAV
ncbi:hypothetical protein HMPREF9120_01340 [Neisseria sp. oral taxon 020 str. F0370]|nr:hypothetical protein HMPREF9120_01340 [Neisseria sp. oral taxon 020 str. F0370]